MTAIKCGKGHDNPQGRQFCQICGSRLVTAAASLTSVEQPEFRQAQEALEAAQQENAQLKGTIDELRVELDRSQDLHGKFLAAESQAAALEPQLVTQTERATAAEAAAAAAVARATAAETKAAAAAAQLASKVKELDQRSSRTGAGAPRSRAAVAIGGLVLASLAAAAGFGTARYLPRSVQDTQIVENKIAAPDPSNGSMAALEEQKQTLVKQQEEWHSKQQQELKALADETLKLNARTKDFDQQKADWSAKQQLEIKERTRQAQDLDRRTQDIEKAERARQARQEQAPERGGRGVAAPAANSLAPGTMVWRGQVSVDQPVSITVSNVNGIVSSSLAGAQVIGSLSGRPCALEQKAFGQDKFDVSAKPSAQNGWNQAVFTVRGNKKLGGWVTVVLVCQPTN